MRDEERTEKLIEACLDKLEQDQDGFSAWERSFLESVEEQNEQGHLSEAQIAKLEEIAEEHGV